MKTVNLKLSKFVSTFLIHYPENGKWMDITQISCRKKIIRINCLPKQIQVGMIKFKLSSLFYVTLEYELRYNTIIWSNQIDIICYAHNNIIIDVTANVFGCVVVQIFVQGHHSKHEWHSRRYNEWRWANHIKWWHSRMIVLFAGVWGDVCACFLCLEHTICYLNRTLQVLK